MEGSFAGEADSGAAGPCSGKGRRGPSPADPSARDSSAPWRDRERLFLTVASLYHPKRLGDNRALVIHDVPELRSGQTVAARPCAASATSMTASSMTFPSFARARVWRRVPAPLARSGLWRDIPVELRSGRPVVRHPCARIARARVWRRVHSQRLPHPCRFDTRIGKGRRLETDWCLWEQPQACYRNSLRGSHQGLAENRSPFFGLFRRRRRVNRSGICYK